MPSAHNEIAQAIQAALLDDPTIVEDRVFRGRSRPLKAGHPNGIVIRTIRSSGQTAGVGLSSPKDWTTVYGIECCARADTDELAEDAVDEVLTAAYARLSTLGPSLGLSVENVLPDPAIVWDIEEGDTPIARATFVVQVVHRTSATSLAAWGT